MVVAQVNYTSYITLVGTLAEVVAALNTNGVPRQKIINIFYDGSTISCVYAV
jgi:hypothetical protein